MSPGDLHDGNGLSDATSPDGILSNKIFENVDYDLLTIGTVYPILFGIEIYLLQVITSCMSLRLHTTLSQILAKSGATNTLRAMFKLSTQRLVNLNSLDHHIDTLQLIMVHSIFITSLGGIQADKYRL